MRVDFLGMRSQNGLTLMELLITLTIMSILASAVLPIAQTSAKRSKELELRRNLRIIRSAIDEFKADYDEAVRRKKINKTVGETGYPEDLDELIRGKEWGGLYDHKRKYLRRILKDPFDRYDEGWGLRSYADRPESIIWGGEDIYDVYSQSTRIALDGTPYNAW